MSNAITITVPHKLGLETAKRRIASRLTKLQRDYVAKIAHSEITWAGDVAHVTVEALGSRASAQITVLADLVRVEVQLPWMLAALSGKVRDLVTRNADEVLRIGPDRK
jgi:uncharacterized protein YhdP